MHSNRVEYSTADGVYCTMTEVKLPFCMTEFYSSKIINHRFHVDNNKGKSGKGYEMIIGRDLMVQLGLTAKFKRQVIQWGGATAHTKVTIRFLGKSNLTKRDMCELFM